MATIDKKEQERLSKLPDNRKLQPKVKYCERGHEATAPVVQEVGKGEYVIQCKLCGRSIRGISFAHALADWNV